MTTTIHDLLLGPGELAVLLAARKFVPVPGSPLAEAGLLAPAAVTRPVGAMTAGVPAADLDAGLYALAQPARVLAGRRGARRNEPWPFSVCSRNGAAVILAPEPGGAARLRFPYSDAAVRDWLAGPFKMFATPVIPLPALPPLASGGLLVLLALADIFRGQYPDLDPDWNAPAPISFTAEDVQLAIGRGLNGSDPASLILGFNRLGDAGFTALSRADLDRVLYVFANEGWLTVAAGEGEPTFTISTAFVWTVMTLAWWDLSLAVAVPGGPELRVVQGLAVWSFERQSDGRFAARAEAGSAVASRLGALLGSKAVAAPRPVPSPAPAPAPAVRYCSACGKPNPVAAKFCKACGKEVGSDRKFVK